MIAHWGSRDSQAWDALHRQAAAALQQDWAYGSSLAALGVPVLRARLECDGEVLGQAQFIVRSWGRVASVALCTRGPVWRTRLSPEDETRAFAALKRTLPLKGIRFMAVTPEVEEGQAHGLKPMRRVISGLSTVVLDLSQSMEALKAQLDSRWRYSLTRSEDSGIHIQRVGTNPGQYRWLLDAEMEKRSDRKLEGLPREFFDLYVNSRRQPAANVLTFRADLGRDRVAAMMFLIHGEAATYQIGWTTEAGRDSNAHHLILWRGIQALKEAGVRVLDLGGVNTFRSAGVARFKLGTGGKVVTLAGTYI
jgi:lipid II:glycine glycyltransferase (peptidoglycan interpeptide bridge formation enzyme)